LPYFTEVVVFGGIFKMTHNTITSSDPLTDLEIYALAARIGLNIKGQLDNIWYNGSGISFQITWSPSPTLQASASVTPSIEAPTRHTITLTYALVELIYQEAFDFSMFSMKRNETSMSSKIHTIPSQFELLQAAEFMFESGITFIIFHELGHINQNHGLIRAKYGSSNTTDLQINEFDIHNNENLKKNVEYSTICHATELAADFEAQNWMARSLHSMFKGADFKDHAYLQCSIVSCIMLVFNGTNPCQIDSTPMGSHPTPLLRMDLWVKAYAELAYIFVPAIDKKELTKCFMDASFLALLKWMTRRQLPENPQYTDFFKGAVAHQNYNCYMRKVVNLWTHEYQQARNHRRYGSPLAVLYFTNEIRSLIRANPNIESL
jgi:hypothetical protein